MKSPMFTRPPAAPPAKTNKDLGPEAKNLGGYKPTNSERFPPGPVIRQRHVEIMILSLGPRGPHADIPTLDQNTTSRKRRWLSFGRSPVTYNAKI